MCFLKKNLLLGIYQSLRRRKRRRKLIPEKLRKQRDWQHAKTRLLHKVRKKDANDASAHLFGDRELNRSQGDPELRFKKVFTDVSNLDASLDGKEVIVRGRLHNSRAKGKLCLIVMRQ